MITINLNSELKEIKNTLTLAQLIEQLGMVNKRFAIEVNEEIIPRTLHKTYTLSSNDKVEIVTAVGGG